MTDLARIKRNVARMVSLGAPEADIDGYIASEGVTVEDVRNFKGVTRLTGGVPDRGGFAERFREDQPKPALDFGTATAATLNGIVDGIPVLGPMARDITDRALAGIGALMGGDYQQGLADIQARREAINQAAPIANVAGSLAGGLGSFGGLAKTLGNEAMGLAGNFGTRVVNSALSNAAVTGADSMVRGRSGADTLGDMAISAGLGGIMPVLGAGAKMAGGAFNNGVLRPIATAFNRDNEAIGRIGRAIAQDARVAPGLTGAQETIAQRAGAEVVNADRFGSAIRSLARTAANVSPEAKGALTGVVEDRFHTQGQRAGNFVRQLMGGATDDLALQDALRTGAQAANDAGYAAARRNPAARAIWNQPIRELMQSDTFRAAIREAESRGTDRAALTGAKAVRNPFVFTPDGGVTLRQNVDGSRALPSLDFWDQVKRNLDRMIDGVRPTPLGGGNRTEFADLTGLKRKLVDALDSAVPEYRAARRGAAGFFGAEDAIEAGRKAATSTRQNTEIARAVAAMSSAEKDAFSVGFASELVDRINATRDRVNVINTIFGSNESREKIAIALGAHRARELEAYVRVEQTLDMLRQAVTGNSNTTQQLIAAGVLGGAGGFFASGGNLQQGATWATLAAAGRRGMQVLGKRVDEQVMRRVAEMLTSNDPAQVHRAIQNASLSQQHMDAINAIMRGIELSARGAASTLVH